MESRLADLSCKEIINICDGQRLGYVDDVILNIVDGRLLALVVPGPAKFFGLLGREDDYIIPWERITRIGSDIILVEVREQRRECRPKRKWF